MSLLDNPKARLLVMVLQQLSDHPELQEDIQKMKDLGGELLAKAIPLATKLAEEIRLGDQGPTTVPAQEKTP
jgi:hypothetical protein